MLTTIARMAGWGFAIVIAVDQIGAATTLVNTLLTGLVAALALSLAFGLGGRATAGEIVKPWYQKSQEAAPKVERAASAASKQVAS